jgi:hypothetical protein
VSVRAYASVCGGVPGAAQGDTRAGGWRRRSHAGRRWGTRRPRRLPRAGARRTGTAWLLSPAPYACQPYTQRHAPRTLVLYMLGALMRRLCRCRCRCGVSVCARRGCGTMPRSVATCLAVAPWPPRPQHAQNEREREREIMEGDMQAQVDMHGCGGNDAYRRRGRTLPGARDERGWPAAHYTLRLRHCRRSQSQHAPAPGTRHAETAATTATPTPSPPRPHQLPRVTHAHTHTHTHACTWTTVR